MSNWYSDRLRNWMLGAAATGLFWQSVPAFGQMRTSLFSTRRIPVKPAPVQTTEPPRLLAVPDENAATNSIQPASQLVAAGDKSEVQKQLDALAEQDGREMPNMDMKLQPMVPNGAVFTNARVGNEFRDKSRLAIWQARDTSRTKANAYGFRIYAVLTAYTTSDTLPASIERSSPANSRAAFEAQAEPQQLPQQQPPARKNPVIGFFKRIGGGNKPLSTQAPVPPDYNNVSKTMPPTNVKYAPPANPSSQMAQQLAPPNLSETPYQGIPNVPAVNIQISSGVGSMPAELPPAAPAIPPLSQDPLPLNATPTQNFLPPLLTEPLAPNVASTIPPSKSESDSEKTRPVVGDLAADFPNPFTEVTESEADLKNGPASKADLVGKDAVGPAKVAKAAEPESKRDEKIIDKAPLREVFKAVEPEAKSETKPEVATPSDEDPYEVDVKDFAEPSINNKFESKPVGTNTPIDGEPHTTTESEIAPSELNPSAVLGPPTGLTPPTTDASKSPGSTTPPVVAPSFDTGAVVPAETTPDPQVEKMRRIRERFGMKGLKGFCPVTLHDERELIDARPEFHFTYRSQKFHFASEDAREKFEADPSRYAPAAYGADVVALSRDKDVVEGTLDFAAWFKGRLYLFGTQANYDTFIASPAKYATLVGIE